MRACEFLTEVRSGAWRATRAMVPTHWPDYVVKDWLYVKLSEPSQTVDKREYIKELLKTYPVRQWRLETRDFGYHSFNAESQKRLLDRMGQTILHFTVPRDDERHEIQANLIKQTGRANQEPIIVIQRPGIDGVELVEGWHRTIQNLKAFPNGWHGQAWVGYL
jgi:hypothetical protein